MTPAKLCFSALLFLLSSLAVGEEAQPQKGPEIEFADLPCSLESAVRVSVDSDNQIWFNQSLVTLEELETDLHKLPAQIKEVCYTRADPESYEPPTNAPLVLQKIKATKLRLSIYWDMNFQQKVVFKQP